MTIERQNTLFGRLLYVFAAWTLLIKYILPVGWALSRGEPLTTYIYFWDAWWILHIAVGTGLVRQNKKVWIWAFLLALAEIIIIISKFVLFAMGPQTDFWHLNWFINKCFLLVYFIGMMIWLFRKEVRQFYGKT